MATFKCTNCSSTKFQDDLTIRERICKKCGMASPMPEEIGEGRKSRYRLGTKTNTKDSFGKTIIGKQQTIQKKRKYAESTDQNTAKINITLKKLEEKILSFSGHEEFHPASERALFILKKSKKRKSLATKETVAKTCAAFYAACREINISKEIRQIAKSQNVYEKRVRMIYRFMLREFPELEPKPDDPKLKLQKMITGMSVKQEDQLKAQIKAGKMIEKFLKLPESSGRNPSGVAASAVYLCVKGLTQNEASECSGVSLSTIASNVKVMRKVLKLN
jgi:transcription initiation factor TFIIIB Brf1 subunit/transcription initiation factor TFIIB